MVKNGDRVKVHYKGTLKDGSVFDSSEGREPLGFTVGAGEMIAGFDKAVVGMEVGQTKKVTIPFMEAYGPYRDEMKLEISKDQLPPDMSPKVGDHLQMQQRGGRPVDVVVTAVSDKSLTLDANHPMAGKDLTFEIKLVDVKSDNQGK
jgi:peptidylprolyl isomerase